MKKRKLFIALLLLMCLITLTTVNAQDNSTDIISLDNDDVLLASGNSLTDLK